MSAPQTILVVEDEPAFVDALREGLGAEGFRVQAVDDGAKALAAFEAVAPDVVLLDVMLPSLSGLDVCREIRRTSNVPIIMVTAKSAEVDTVVALEVGADDYITKPYRLRELIARIRAVLRRAEDANGSESPTEVESLSAGPLVLDPERYEVTLAGDPVELPRKEFALLQALLERAGRVVTRDRLIEEVWGRDYVGDTKTLDVHVKRLRAKIEDDPTQPERLVTVRGVGYKLLASGDD